jgi:hypothetical protein
MKEDRRKEKLFWIGEHANEVLKNTDKNVLSFFDNEVLLFDRDDNNLEPKNSTTYLDEFYPMINREYNLGDLNKPVVAYLKQIKAHSSPGLMIGNGCELLFQAVVNSSFNKKLSKPIDNLKKDFLQVENIESKERLQLTDLAHKDVLFLKDRFPFPDIIAESKASKEVAKKGFKNVLSAKKDMQNLNEFLWSYHEGLDLAVKNSNDITLTKNS